MKPRRWRRTLVLLVPLAALASCGPVRALTATSQANDNLFRAELAGAHELVPGEKYITPARYEYQLAYYYIEKSKELQGFSKFDAAYRYASRAAELAKKAVEHRAEEERRKIRRQQIRAGHVFNKPEGRQ